MAVAVKVYGAPYADFSNYNNDTFCVLQDATSHYYYSRYLWRQFFAANSFGAIVRGGGVVDSINER